MSELLTALDVSGRIQWEGGITDALDAGLKHEQIEPGELRDAWRSLEDIYNDHFRDVIYRIDQILEDAEYEYE